MNETLLRIGELGRRAGVSPDLLRAWERRYGLLSPVRSSGGLRLYSLADLARVRLMRRHLEAGLAAAEAAALAAQAPIEQAGTSALQPGEAIRELAEALDAFDEATAQALVDQTLAGLTLDAFLTEIVLPYLRELGDRWQRGEISVAQEHFASSILRGRLLGLARGWGRGLGPQALLACAPEEEHDLGLIAFGLTLRARGWRITFLGSNTPIETVADAARSFEPTLLVVSAVNGERFRSIASELRTLSQRHRLALGGAGADAVDAGGLGTLALTGDLVSQADQVTKLAMSARGG